MNDTDLQKYLKEIDKKHSPQDEFPEGFDYLREIERVVNFSIELERSTGLKLKIDDQVQDAFFFADVSAALSEIQKSDDIRGDDYLKIRFSCFGRMAAYAIDGVDSDVKRSLSLAVKESLEHNGYIPISSTWLMFAQYDGVHAYFIDRRDSWWYRFFDYT